MNTTPLAAALFALSATLNPAFAQPTATPYQAVISRAKVDVFSGPGGQYYRTGVLTDGAKVEVHRTMGGYLGIRPPEGSFSWAPGSDLQEVEPGIFQVIRDGVPSRVGSLLTEERNVVHIRLSQGERVRVLSRMMLDGAEWAQIAPPAGEFRWIRAEDISTGSQQTADEVFATAETTQSEVAQQELIVIEAPPADAVVKNEPPQVVKPPAAAEPAPFIAEAKPLSEWVQSASHDEPTQLVAPPPATSGPAPAASVARAMPPAQPAATGQLAHQPFTPTGTFQQQLTALDIELSRRVSGPSYQWQVDDIGAAAARLLASTPDPQQQAAARSLATRVGRFASIASRQRQMTAQTPAATPTKTAAPPPIVSPFAAPQEKVGELRSVVSKRADAPKFALVDETGQVTTFLSPQSGMDLKPLVGKRVSVAGVQGYLPSIRSQHIAATRVAQLPTTTR